MEARTMAERPIDGRTSTTWRVRVQTTAVDQGWDELLDSFLGALETAPGASGVVGHGELNHLGATFCVEASDPEGAAEAAGRCARFALTRAGITAELERLEVEPYDESE
jgi:hypothetical protein